MKTAAWFVATFAGALLLPHIEGHWRWLALAAFIFCLYGLLTRGVRRGVG